MTKGGKYFWPASGAAATVLVLLMFYLIFGGSGVSYQNKPLDRYWFRQVPLTAGISGLGFSQRIAAPGQRYGNYEESPVATRKAFEEMGTNCLPFLVNKLGRSDSSRFKTIQKWAFKLHIGFLLGRSADAERSQAVTALIWLGEKGLFSEEIIKRIRELSQNKDAGIAAAANVVLMYSRTQPSRERGVRAFPQIL
jgi:hypothetical protein